MVIVVNAWRLEARFGKEDVAVTVALETPFLFSSWLKVSEVGEWGERGKGGRQGGVVFQLRELLEPMQR